MFLGSTFMLIRWWLYMLGGRGQHWTFIPVTAKCRSVCVYAHTLLGSAGNRWQCFGCFVTINNCIHDGGWCVAGYKQIFLRLPCLIYYYTEYLDATRRLHLPAGRRPSSGLLAQGSAHILLAEVLELVGNQNFTCSPIFLFERWIVPYLIDWIIFQLKEENFKANIIWRNDAVIGMSSVCEGSSQQKRLYSNLMKKNLY